MNSVLWGVAAYIAGQLAIGFWVSRKISGDTDYFLAGRRLGFGLSTFSIFATWFGAETCIGAAAEAYDNGVTGATAEPFAYGICLLVMGFIFAVPLWQRKLVTLADLFRSRYGEGVERAAAILMVPTSILWAGAQIRTFGQVLAASSSFEISAAITVAALVVVVYTVSGGLLADAVTDLVQGTALIVGLSVVALAVYWGAGASGIPDVPLRLFPDGDAGLLDLAEAWAIPICGSVVAQELIARISASRSPGVARRGSLVAGAGYLAFGAIPLFIGLMARGLELPIESAEQVLPHMAQAYLSPGLYILFAGALVSAILSTVDSCLLVASSLVTQNLLATAYPALTPRQRLFSARAGVVAAGAVAYVLALSSESVFGLVEEASGFGSAGIFVLLVFGLFSHRGGRASAYAALLSGVSVWIAGYYIMEMRAPYLASLAAAFLAYAAFSRIKPASEAPSPVLEAVV